MKKLNLLFLFSLISLISFSQVGPYVGGHYAFNSTWLMNKQVFDHGSEMDPSPTFGSYYGFIAGYNFTDDAGIEININLNNINQKYEGRFGDNRYISQTNINALDIPLLFKFGYNSYFEIGPVLQMLNGATYSRTFDNTGLLHTFSYKGLPVIPTDVDSEGVLNQFNSTNFAVALGFGASIDIIEYKLKLDIGLRFQYTITDMEGINGLGYGIESNFVPGVEKETFKNNALIGGVRLGLNYYFM